MITYKTISLGAIAVYLDGKRIGTIEPSGSGYRYKPLNSKVRGEVFETIAEVKRSIEG